MRGYDGSNRCYHCIALAIARQIKTAIIPSMSSRIVQSFMMVML